MSKQKAIQENWDGYKAVIQKLYLTEDKPLKDVMAFMKDEYSFHATRAQYERQFKKWKFRKNLSDRDWTVIHDRVEKRKRDLKESDVYIDDILVSTKKVKKEVSRHVPIIRDFIPASTPATPEGIRICTPQALLSQEISLEGLPWFRLQDDIDHQVAQYFIIPSISGTEYGLTSPGPSSEMNTPNSAVNLLGREPQSSGLQWASRSTLNLSFLKATLVERYNGEHVANFQQLFTSANHASALLLLKLAVYLSSNNMLFEKHMDQFFQRAFELHGYRALKALISINTPAIKASGPHLLRSATRLQNVQAVQTLLDTGIDPSSPSPHDRYTPLQIAAETGNSKLVRVLVKACADVNRCGWYPANKPALQIAVNEGHIEVVRILIEAGANVNASSLGHSLEVAAISKRNKCAIIELLLKAGADFNSLNSPSSRRKIFQEVLKEDRIDLFHELLQATVHLASFNSSLTATEGFASLFSVPAQADVNYTTQTKIDYGNALQELAPVCTVEVLQTLLDAGADVNTPISREKGQTALQAVSEAGDLEKVQLLLQAGADVNASAADWGGMTALQAAASSGNTAIVNVLLESGANVNAPAAYEKGMTALQAAACNGSISVVLKLLEAGADVNALPAEFEGRTAIEVAIDSWDEEMVETLLDAEVDVNTRTCYCSSLTPLQYAAMNCRLEMIQMLLEAGADVNAFADGDVGRTALQAAAEQGHIDIIELLLESDADVNASAAEEWGMTALQAAAREGHVDIVQILLERGADVNASAAENGGRTALQAAAVSGRVDVVQTLLERGADVNAPAASFSGITSLQGAAEEGHVDIVQTLLERDADVNAPAASDGGVTALQGAAIGGHLGIAHMLLEANADVNAAPAELDGRSALEGAAEHGRLDMVHLLLRNGADLHGHVAAGHKKSPEDLARKQGHIAVANYIKDWQK